MAKKLWSYLSQFQFTPAQSQRPKRYVLNAQQGYFNSLRHKARDMMGYTDEYLDYIFQFTPAQSQRPMVADDLVRTGGISIHSGTKPETAILSKQPHY